MTNSAKTAASVRPRHKRGKHWLQRDWRLYLMLLIPIVWYILFCYKPMAGLQIAFQKYNMFNPAKSKWIWLDNFKFVFGMSDFGIALKNTLILNGLDLLFGFPVPIILAILLNEMRTPMLKKFSQTMLYLPHFLSWVIIGGMVLQIFAPTSGGINSTLLRWGWISENIPFLTDGPTWTFTYVLVGVWQSMGWGTILYLAAITGLDMNLFEAARIDGAGEFRILLTIVLPMSVPMVATMTLLIGLSYWNDWKNGLYYLQQNKSLYSIQVLLNDMLRDVQALKSGMDAAAAAEITANMPSTGIKMAIAVVGVLPVLIVYPFFQKYFVKGITIGAVKG